MSNAFIDGLGELLARTREERGISQADAAQRLKLSARQIEAIEAEDWTHLPGEVFRRGFVRNYARLLELNPDDLVRPVDAEATATHTITAPSEGLSIGHSPIARWVAFPLAGLLLFLLVVALLYQWLRQGEQALVTPVEPAVTGQPAQTAPAAGPSTVAPLPGTGEESAAAPATEGDSGTVVLPLPLNPQPVSQPPAGEVPAATPPPASPVPGSPAGQTPGRPAAQGLPALEASGPGLAGREASPATAGIVTIGAVKTGVALRFSAGEDAWIQVVDGQGQRFSKLVRGGGQEQLSGSPPFKLVVGNAAQVKLTYNGHQIDLTPFIGEKVARLTLE